MHISRNVSRAAQAMGIAGYTERILKCWCGTHTNVLWSHPVLEREVIACSHEHASQLPKELPHDNTHPLAE